MTPASACGTRTKQFQSLSGAPTLIPVCMQSEAGLRLWRGARQLVSWTEDILFTRLDIHDAHWKSSRKTLARAFSADEIRRAQLRV